MEDDTAIKSEGGIEGERARRGWSYLGPNYILSCGGSFVCCDGYLSLSSHCSGFLVSVCVL